MDEATLTPLLKHTDPRIIEIAIAIFVITHALKQQPGFDVAAFESKVDDAAAQLPCEKFWLSRAILSEVAGKPDPGMFLRATP